MNLNADFIKENAVISTVEGEDTELLQSIKRVQRAMKYQIILSVVYPLTVPMFLLMLVLLLLIIGWGIVIAFVFILVIILLPVLILFSVINAVGALLVRRWLKIYLSRPDELRPLRRAYTAIKILMVIMLLGNIVFFVLWFLAYLWAEPIRKRIAHG